MYSVRISHQFKKPVDEIFSALADHENLHKVFVLPVKRVKDGKPDVNGVGSVRKLGFGPLGIEETVTALAQNERINYQITKGGQPLISQHKGAVAFKTTASAGCTGQPHRGRSRRNSPLGTSICQAPCGYAMNSLS